MYKKIVIDSKIYRLSPLKCKSLKQISELMSEGELSSDEARETIENWTPFVLASLRIEHPNVTKDLVEELTLEEFNSVLTSVISLSGIKLTTKQIQEKKDDDEDNGADWDWIYARLCVCSSLRYKDIDNMTLREVESVLEYLVDNPTEAEILVAVHGVKTNRNRWHAPSEKEFEGKFNHLLHDPKHGIAGAKGVQHVSGLPENMRANLHWAEDLQAKYRKAMKKRPN